MTSDEQWNPEAWIKTLNATERAYVERLRKRDATAKAYFESIRDWLLSFPDSDPEEGRRV